MSQMTADIDPRYASRIDALKAAYTSRRPGKNIGPEGIAIDTFPETDGTTSYRWRRIPWRQKFTFLGNFAEKVLGVRLRF